MKCHFCGRENIPVVQAEDAVFGHELYICEDCAKLTLEWFSDMKDKQLQDDLITIPKPSSTNTKKINTQEAWLFPLSQTRR